MKGGQILFVLLSFALFYYIQWVFSANLIFIHEPLKPLNSRPIDDFVAEINQLKATVVHLERNISDKIELNKKLASRLEGLSLSNTESAQKLKKRPIKKISLSDSVVFGYEAAAILPNMQDFNQAKTTRRKNYKDLLRGSLPDHTDESIILPSVGQKSPALSQMDIQTQETVKISRDTEPPTSTPTSDTSTPTSTPTPTPTPAPTNFLPTAAPTPLRTFSPISELTSAPSTKPASVSSEVLFDTDFSSVSYPDGTLVACTKEVFVIRNGSRNGFPNYAVFESWGFSSLTKVISLNCNKLLKIPLGPPMILRGQIGDSPLHNVKSPEMESRAISPAPLQKVKSSFLHHIQHSPEAVKKSRQLTPRRNKTGRFYMYDLDERYWWRWPNPGTSCYEGGYVNHPHAELSGLGRPIELLDGLFDTWHFSLFSSLYNRMKRSSRRTYDPAEASLFIIPYDLAMDGYINPKRCSMRQECSPGLVNDLQDMLLRSPYYTRHMGADHAVLWSLGQYHPWPYQQCNTFIKNFCANCTFTCYWMDATKMDNKFISVPFPSAYHYWDGIKSLPWDLAHAPDRNYTVVYLGSLKTLNPLHTKIRRAMAEQCQESSHCHWLKIEHSSVDKAIVSLISVYKKAVFCLCPPGDDPARKAVFDSIISGCIPVIFEVKTIYNQYPWHLGESVAQDISVNIPADKMRSGELQFMQVLLRLPPELIMAKQEAIASVAPRLQYSVPPLELMKVRNDSTLWEPPFEDGVDVTLDGLFDRTDKMVKHQSTGIPVHLRSNREWSRDYDRVIAKSPAAHTKNPFAEYLHDNRSTYRLIFPSRLIVSLWLYDPNCAAKVET